MNTQKVVVISGGTYGIGRQMSLDLSAAGYKVLAFGIDTAQPMSTAEGSVRAFALEVNDKDLDIEVMHADVSNSSEVSEVISRALERFGRVDAVVNNAAVGPLGTVLDTEEEMFDKIMAVNLRGPYLISRAVLPLFLEQKGGAIVNIGSGAGWGKPNMSAYSASKGGLHALSAAMAYDFLNNGIRVNTVIPGGGGIASGMTYGRVGGEQNIDKNAPGSAAGRPVNGSDLANVIDFLISDKGEAISGTVIDVGCFANQGGPAPRKDRK